MSALLSFGMWDVMAEASSPRRPLFGAVLALSLAACAAPGRRVSGPYSPYEKGERGVASVPSETTRRLDAPGSGGFGGSYSRSSTTPSSTSAPSWASAPLSWSKLSGIESWLTTEGDRAAAYWRVEGWLQLGQGKLTLARRELVTEAGAGGVLGERLQGARTSFEQVLVDAGATRSQRTRAQVGLSAAGALLEGAPRPATFTRGKLVARSKWGARRANPSNMNSAGGSWQRITVHHSAVENPPPMFDVRDSAAAVRDMQRVHMDVRGWGDIGYHFLIDPGGYVLEGRTLDWQGAHTGGSNNARNIGICLIGNFDLDQPTPSALAALENLVNQLRSTHHIAGNQVFPHKRFKNTECPGRHLLAWIERYRSRG